MRRIKKVHAAKSGSKPESIPFSKRQKELQKELSHAIGIALPLASTIDDNLRRMQSPYERVARVLVMLRHECSGPDGRAHDLNGRSAAYRTIVRRAYVQAGADPDSSVSKRLTAGTAYWVRKLLLDRYGEQKLLEMGVISRKRSSAAPDRQTKLSPTDQDKLTALQEAVGALNTLASDPELVPTENLVHAAVRAVDLLRQKLTNGKLSDRFTKVAV